jgi:hypothetical protein
MVESSACEGSRRTHIRYGLPVPRSADNGLSPSAEVLEPQWVLAFALVNLEHVDGSSVNGSMPWDRLAAPSYSTS